jgi:RPA family protein
MTELPGNRETAYRVFAAEFDDATVEHQESDEERAPNYVITPTGARVNRLFAVGVLTEVEAVNDDVLRARIVDPTGAFVVYAGQYQPDEMAALERLDPPAFVALTGKARTFSPEDSDRVYSSIRPESINTVDADTRDRWVVRTAEHTVERVGTLAAAATLDATGDSLRETLAQSGLPAATASGSALALDHYGTTAAYLAGVHDLAVDAARVVAGEMDEVDAYDRAPSDTGDGSAAYAALARDLDVQPTAGVDADASDAGATDAEAADAEAVDVDSPDAGAAITDAEAPETAAPDSDGETESTASDADTEPVADDGDDHEEALEATAEVTAATTESAVDASSTDDATAGDSPDADSTVSEATDTETSADDGVGDFEPGDDAGASGANTDEMYEFDEEEREAIEDEYGTDFASGNDVPDPGESDLDAPEPDEQPAGDEVAADAGDAETDAEDAETGTEDAETGGDDDATAAAADEADPGEAAADETADDVDLDEYVLETMRELDDGDGAARDELVDRVVEETGADADAVEDALQDALMGGRCYEPDDGVLKPI